MNPMATIRKRVFRVTQAEFASIVGASQGTVSRWEQGELEPTREQLAAIRTEAKTRGLTFSDKLFFEEPAQ